MANVKKRALSLALALVMLFTLLPTTALAAASDTEFHIMGMESIKGFVRKAAGVPDNETVKIYGIYVNGICKEPAGKDKRASATGGMVDPYSAPGDLGYPGTNGKLVNSDYNGWKVLNDAKILYEDSVTSITIFARIGDDLWIPNNKQVVTAYLSADDLKPIDGKLITQIYLNNATLTPPSDVPVVSGVEVQLHCGTSSNHEKAGTNKFDKLLTNSYQLGDVDENGERTLTVYAAEYVEAFEDSVNYKVDGLKHMLAADESNSKTITLEKENDGTWVPESPSDATIKFKVVCSNVPAVTDITKEVMTTAPAGVTVPAGITYPEQDGTAGLKPIELVSGQSITLLYKITVTGDAGAAYTVTDAGAEVVYGSLTGTLGDSKEAVIYVTKTFEADDAVNGVVSNTASIDGKVTDTDTETVPVTVLYPVDYAFVSSTADETLPDGVTSQLVKPETVQNRAVGTATSNELRNASYTPVDVTDASGKKIGTWSFEGWTPAEGELMTKDGLTYKGSWTYTPVTAPDTCPVYFYLNLESAKTTNPDQMFHSWYYLGQGTTNKGAPVKGTDTIKNPVAGTDFTAGVLEFPTVVLDGKGYTYDAAGKTKGTYSVSWDQMSVADGANGLSNTSNATIVPAGTPTWHVDGKITFVTDDCYKLTYDVNGGNADGPDPRTGLTAGTYGLDISKKPTHAAVNDVPVVFIGWTATRSSQIYGKDDWAPILTYNATIENADVVVYAAWGYDANNDGAVDLFENKFTVIYTDGLGGEVFANEVHSDLLSGANTPAFEGKLERANYVFDGWTPVVADKVVAPADGTTITYTATWATDVIGPDTNRDGKPDPDGIPDYKQAVVYFESSDSSYGTVNKTFEVFTLKKKNESGEYTELVKAEATAEVNSNSSRNRFSNWTLGGEKVDGDTKLAYTFVAKGGETYTFTANFYRRSSNNNNHNNNNTTIKEEDVPLAGGPQLNKEDHFAYIKGYADGTVRPNNYITRAQVATIFYRLLTDESRAIYFSDSNDYPDVTDDYWANKAISTLSNAGIITGFSDGTFRPNAYITRAQFAAISARFSVVTEDLPNPFSDVPAGYWAEDLIAYAAEIGWVSGYSDGTFRPDNYITRAAAMKLINNVLERRVDEEGLLAGATHWTDNTPDDWHYFVVLEATNSHDYDRRSKKDLMEDWTKLTADRVWDE